MTEKKTTKKEIWDKDNPKSSPEHMSPSEKGAATKSAHKQGRSKPGLVDNINAKKKSAPKNSTKAK